jgi:wax ester synthase-like acyl-CoA acyltransferase family protein
MRQLTAVDVQFLAIEGPRHYGHVGGVAVVDPSTAPGGILEVADLQYLIAERLPLVPPFRWRLVEVPLGLDYGYWIDDPDFDLERWRPAGAAGRRGTWSSPTSWGRSSRSTVRARGSRPTTRSPWSPTGWGSTSRC